MEWNCAERSGKERKGVVRKGKEREVKERNGTVRKGEERPAEYKRTQGERSNHVCPAEVTTGLQVLIMC